MSFAHDFGPFEGQAWINCAHQGAMPRVAVEAAREMLSWRVRPHLTPDEAFAEVPRRLKHALAGFIGGRPEDIVLGNSASYALHLIANGLPWEAGDEVLLAEGDFPASILPWLGLRKRGVAVRFVHSRGAGVEPDELRAALRQKTRLFCLSWVNSFTGYAADVEALGKVCREYNVYLIVNASQAVGNRPLHVSRTAAHAISTTGAKWLCGPYGTGFCWLHPELLARLEYNQAYWLALQGTRGLNQMRDYELRHDLGAAAYDVFGTANFLNFVPWTVAVDYLEKIGIEEIARYDQQLVDRLIDGLDANKYRLISPAEGPRRSTLVTLSHQKSERNFEVYECLKRENVHISFREGNLRFSPHLYNTNEEIDHALTVLNTV